MLFVCGADLCESESHFSLSLHLYLQLHLSARSRRLLCLQGAGTGGLQEGGRSG